MTYSICSLLLIASLITTSASDEGCGVPDSSTELIFGGQKVNPAHWPWIAVVFNWDEDSASLGFQCGGTLVSNNVVLTAGHCVIETKDASKIAVSMGKRLIFHWSSESEELQTRHVKRIVIHPSYLTARKKGADLAVLILSSPVKYTDFVRPVCLWRSDFDQSLSGIEGAVVGWGRDEEGDIATDEPRLTRQPLVSNEECVRSNKKLARITSQYTYCAGKRDGTGPCSGDSGSGMYVLKRFPSGEKRYVIRGLVSKSLIDIETQQCDLENYVVFADLAVLKPWLDEVMPSTDENCLQRYRNKIQSLGMVNLVGNYYYFSSKELTRTKSEEFCRKNGLELVSIESQEEQDAIGEHARNDIYWLGGYKHGDKWAWSGYYYDYYVGFTSWRPGQPNNRGGNENHMVLLVNSDGSHGWLDDNLNSVHKFICELEKSIREECSVLQLAFSEP